MEELTSDEIHQIFNFRGGSKDKQYLKIRLKDAWGNSVFAIKGKPPQWFFESPIVLDSKKSKNLKNITIGEYSTIALNLSGGRYEVVSRKYNRSILAKEGFLTEIVALSVGKTTYYVRKCYMRAIKLAHGDVPLYINKEKMLLCAKKVEEVVAMVALLDTGKMKIYTPESVLKELSKIPPDKEKR